MAYRQINYPQHIVVSSIAHPNIPGVAIVGSLIANNGVFLAHVLSNGHLMADDKVHELKREDYSSVVDRMVNSRGVVLHSLAEAVERAKKPEVIVHHETCNRALCAADRKDTIKMLLSRNQSDLLVCTPIVKRELDNPRKNTCLIDDIMHMIRVSIDGPPHCQCIYSMGGMVTCLDESGAVQYHDVRKPHVTNELLKNLYCRSKTPHKFIVYNDTDHTYTSLNHQYRVKSICVVDENGVGIIVDNSDGLVA